MCVPSHMLLLTLLSLPSLHSLTDQRSGSPLLPPDALCSLCAFAVVPLIVPIHCHVAGSQASCTRGLLLLAEHLPVLDAVPEATLRCQQHKSIAVLTLLYLPLGLSISANLSPSRAHALSLSTSLCISLHHSAPLTQRSQSSHTDTALCVSV